jgi:hypothetical protein
MRSLPSLCLDRGPVLSFTKGIEFDASDPPGRRLQTVKFKAPDHIASLSSGGTPGYLSVR